MRRALGLQPRINDSLSIGRALHELFLAPLRLVNRVGAGDVIEELSNLKAQLLSDLTKDLVDFGKVVFEASSRILMDLVYDGYPIPIAVEPSLEGTVIGFSDVIKPDLVIGPCLWRWLFRRIPITWLGRNWRWRFMAWR